MAAQTDVQERRALLQPLGGTLEIQETEQAVYEVSLIEAPSVLPKFVEGIDRKDWEFRFGPFKIIIYVILETLEIGVEPFFLGARLGEFYGNLRQGLVINVDLVSQKIKVRVVLEDRDIVLYLKLTGVFDFEKRIVLMSL